MSQPLGPTSQRFDTQQLPNLTPLGARLQDFSREWDALTTDRYVRSIVREGYRVDLLGSPPLSPDPIPMELFRDTDRSKALRREIMSLLDKGEIEELNPRSLSPGFYSRLFLVPKTDGSHRPVFDLKSLNQFVHKEKFKMTTPRTVTNAMHKGDWAVSIDLKDAYFHVPIHVRSRRLLRFAIVTNDGLRVFQFRALPFGVTSAPRIFTKVILPLGHHAYLHSVCLLQYLDDWLLRSPKQVAVGSANKLVAGDHSSSGICAKRAQITTCAHSAFDTYRVGISFGLRSDVPSDDQSSKVRRQDIDTPVGVSHDSLFLDVPPRTAVLSNRCNSTRQIASQTSATVFACSLGAGLERSQGSCPSEA